jgi:multidrug efflux system membrane fusion protein
VTKVVQRDVPIDVQVVGNVEAYLTVMVKAQVSGELTRVHFHEGDYVHKGDLLFTVDPRLVQAQLTQAQANLARDEAQLAAAEATLAKDSAQEKYARSEAARYARLFESGLISRDQAEQYRSNAEASLATVRADEASVRSARSTVAAQRAAVENIRLQLDYTSIRSPLDGRTGNLNVKQGNVVTANVTDLISIHQVEPIYVSFAVPEARRPEVRRSQLVMAARQGEPGPPESGELTFIDNAVDATTGTIRLKGTFRNSNQRLWPGEFVRTTVRLRTEPGALVIPNQAVQTGQDGTYVFVVKPDQTVEARPVVTGTRVDQDLVIEKGLEAGETVVLEGQLRLAPGSRVQVAGEGGKGPGKGGPRQRPPMP